MRSENNQTQLDNPNNPEIVSFPVDIKHYQLLPFVKAMDEVLTQNDCKGGWQNCSPSYLEARLVEEVGEYFRQVAIHVNYRDRYQKHKPVDKKELIDIANFCMMLWDING